MIPAPIRTTEAAHQIAISVDVKTQLHSVIGIAAALRRGAPRPLDMRERGDTGGTEAMHGLL